MRIRICRLHLLWWIKPTLKNVYSGYNINLHQFVRIQFWSTEECSIPLQCPYFQVHYDLQLKFLFVFCMRDNSYNGLKWQFPVKIEELCGIARVEGVTLH